MMKIAAIIFAGVLALAIANAQETAQGTTAPTETKKTETKKAAPAAAKKTETKTEVKKDITAKLPTEVKALITEDTKSGSGKIAEKGKAIKVNYTGWLYEPTAKEGKGKQFDSSVGSEPFIFTLGGGQVIKGWDEGFKDMKVGGKRKLLIPSEMAYGSRGAGGDVIPPNKALLFEVELLDVMDVAQNPAAKTEEKKKQ